MNTTPGSGPGTVTRPVDLDTLGHGQVLAIAVPIILANVTTPLIGLIDTAVLGQLGDPHYIGGVALGAMIFNLLYWGFGFLRMGTTGLTAQAEGSGDRKETAATLARALLIAAVIGLTVILLQSPIRAAFLALLGGSDAVETSAAEYFDIRIWSAPAGLANFAFLGWFIGIGRARTALILQLLLNGTNAVLDAWFVLGLGLEVKGVAYGTFIAEWLAAIAGLILALNILRQRGTVISMQRVLEKVALKRAFSVNRDIMIRTVCVLFAFTWFTAKSAEAGDVILAANSVLMTLTHVAAYFLDGFAFAAETLSGHAIGAKRINRFRAAVKLSTLWAVGFSVLASVIFWIAGHEIINLLTINEEVRATAKIYLIWAALVPVVGVMAYQLDGIYIGATRTADMRNMMVISLMFFMVLWATLTPLFGNHGLWASIVIFIGIRVITLGLRYPALVRNAFPETA